jgi:ankyrin repeat protein
METRSNRRKMTESTVDKIRRGEVSAFDALATELPDVFNAEILSKLQLEDALNLARVNKRYNDAVWSVDGVRAMKRIMGAQRIPRESLDKLGATPMYFAARHGNVPAVRALLKSGVDIDEVVLEGSYTALQTATAWQSPEVVKLLIDAGADVDKCNVDYGTPPLHLAAENGGAMIAMLLIKAGAEVNLADMEGKTPLWFAVDSHNMQMVSMLVRSGAHVDIAPYDDDDMSPMEMAEDTKCEGMLELLRLAPSRIERRCEKTATNLSLGRPAWRVGLTWVEPRFSVGDRVECCIAVDPEEWAPGTVISHWFRFPEWPISHYAPYQIKLDDSEELIFAPEDHDNCIRLVG